MGDGPREYVGVSPVHQCDGWVPACLGDVGLPMHRGREHPKIVTVCGQTDEAGDVDGTARLQRECIETPNTIASRHPEMRPDPGDPGAGRSAPNPSGRQRSRVDAEQRRAVAPVRADEEVAPRSNEDVKSLPDPVHSPHDLARVGISSRRAPGCRSVPMRPPRVSSDRPRGPNRHSRARRDPSS